MFLFLFLLFYDKQYSIHSILHILLKILTANYKIRKLAYFQRQTLQQSEWSKKKKRKLKKKINIAYRYTAYILNLKCHI
jgi:hypothetical protein